MQGKSIAQMRCQRVAPSIIAASCNSGETEENYADMCERVNGLETRDTVVGSSNFGRFMELFGSDDARWIDDINDELEGE